MPQRRSLYGRAIQDDRGIWFARRAPRTRARSKHVNVAKHATPSLIFYIFDGRVMHGEFEFENSFFFPIFIHAFTIIRPLFYFNVFTKIKENLYPTRYASKLVLAFQNFVIV